MTQKNIPLYYEFVEHEITNVSVWGSKTDSGEIVVVSIDLFKHDFGDYKSKLFSGQLNSISSRIKEYLNGKCLDLSEIPLDMGRCSDFERSVLCAARLIPFGKTVSYSELAQMASYPKAIRAVGSVMRKNRFPLVVPCHRVIKKNGLAGGFHGMQAGNEVDVKKRLLLMEKNNAEY